LKSPGDRYIYVPLGGSNNVIVATATVFSFVALWHDLSFRLLAWGWLVSVFILPELAFKRLLPERKVTLLGCVKLKGS
jgi:protein-cysteine N-palmitoyltransferase HHAT